MDYEGIVEVISFHVLPEYEGRVNELLGRGWVLLMIQPVVARDRNTLSPTIIYILGRKGEKKEPGEEGARCVPR